MPLRLRFRLSTLLVAMTVVTIVVGILTREVKGRVRPVEDGQYGIVALGGSKFGTNTREFEKAGEAARLARANPPLLIMENAKKKLVSNGDEPAWLDGAVVTVTAEGNRVEFECHFRKWMFVKLNLRKFSYEAFENNPEAARRNRAIADALADSFMEPYYEYLESVAGQKSG